MLVVTSQNFIRDPVNFGEDCSVSLRDVRRYKKLVKFFRKMRESRSKADDADDARKAARRSMLLVTPALHCDTPPALRCLLLLSLLGWI